MQSCEGVLAVVLKQFAALTDSETCLHRYFPDLFSRWEGLLKTDETSAAYFTLFADAFARRAEGSTLAPFNQGGHSLDTLIGRPATGSTRRAEALAPQTALVSEPA